MSRKLVRVERIDAITPIPGADNIETAHILGWECVIRKDDHYQEGDAVIYFETDSFLPIQEPFMFLGNYQGTRTVNADNEEGFRIRIQNMGPKGGKQISNGLIMCPSTLEVMIPDIASLPIGTDLTEQLGIKIYEKFIPDSVEKISFGYMPVSIRDTDQERIQNLTSWFNSHHRC